MTVRVASLGECMMELRHRGPTALDLAFGGDTLNTAVYLARLGPAAGLAVDYVTALGDDPYSEAMLAMWTGERIGTGLVARLPGRLPGLYAIRTDKKGERSFYYWRSAAAARDMLEGASGEKILTALASYAWIYLSGITLSILAAAPRARLMRALIEARKAGAKIVFDPNYRPRGWPDPAKARAAFTEILKLADLALPSFSDEKLLFGDPDPNATAMRMRDLGVAEVVVKNADEPCLVVTSGGETQVFGQLVPQPVDTTAAGDSFNAAYLASRIKGARPAEAAAAGHVLAAEVIRHPGAVIPKTAMPSAETVFG
ncbi:MAG: sugar kinase [Alphaproteobacteria bacterium]|nr:sugar kinase [Alphaproteobacteria bacterium]